MLSNAKKIFNKSLKETIQSVYNPQYTVEYIVYPPFSNGSDLLIDLWELLNIKPSKKPINEEIPSSIHDELTNYFWILLDPSFRFDNFVAWSNNQFAFSAAKAVAETPWTAYNPLFIYWNVWLGKTHLMQAIWNEINSNNPEKVIIYLPATKLIDEIILAIQKRNLSSLMRKFDNVDVLLIDDVQFLAWKDKTQEIFHNIFNDFHLKKKTDNIFFRSPSKRAYTNRTEIKNQICLRISSWYSSTRLRNKDSNFTIKTRNQTRINWFRFIMNHCTKYYLKCSWTRMSIKYFINQKKIKLKWNFRRRCLRLSTNFRILTESTKNIHSKQKFYKKFRYNRRNGSKLLRNFSRRTQMRFQKKGNHNC